MDNVDIGSFLLELEGGNRMNDATRESKLRNVVKNPNVDAFRSLINDKIDIEMGVTAMGDSALMYLCYDSRSAFDQCNQCIQLLIDAKANVNKQGYLNWSPLLCASLNQNYDRMKMLIDAKANVNAKPAASTGLKYEVDEIKSAGLAVLLGGEVIDLVDDKRCLELLVLNGAQMNKNNKRHQRFVHDYIEILKSSIPFPVDGGHFLLHEELASFSLHQHQ